MNLLSNTSLKTPTTEIQVSSPLRSLRESLSKLSSKSKSVRSSRPESESTSAAPTTTTTSSETKSEPKSEPAGEASMYTTIQGFLPAWLGWMVSIKMLLVVLFGAVLFWQFRPYFAYMNDLVNMVKSLMDASIGLASATSTNIVDSTAKGSTVVVNKISGKKKPPSPTPEPDDSTSSVQGGAAGGFCLAGEWKGVRSCVRVSAGKDCTSGKVFSTKEQCVTPELRRG